MYIKKKTASKNVNIIEIIIEYKHIYLYILWKNTAKNHD